MTESLMQKDPTWREVGVGGWGGGVGGGRGDGEGTLGLLSSLIPPLPENTSVFLSLPHTFSTSFAHLLTPVTETFNY